MELTLHESFKYFGNCWQNTHFLYKGETSANFYLSGYAQSFKIPFHIFSSIGPDTSKVSNRHFGKIFLKVPFLILFSIFSMVVSEKWNSDIYSPTNSLIFKKLDDTYISKELQDLKIQSLL